MGKYISLVLIFFVYSASGRVFSDYKGGTIEADYVKNSGDYAILRRANGITTGVNVSSKTGSPEQS